MCCRKIPSWKRRATGMTGIQIHASIQHQLSGPCQHAFVVGLFVLLPPLSILDGESKDSTPPLQAIKEEDQKEVNSLSRHSTTSEFNWILGYGLFCTTQASYRRLIYPTQAPLVSLRKIFCGKGSLTLNLLTSQCE